MCILCNLQIFLNFLGIIIIIALVNVWLLIPTVFLGMIFVYLRRFYLCSARDVKRLEGITRSPVFTHLSTSLQGLTTIRAFEMQQTFMDEFDSHQVRPTLQHTQCNFIGLGHNNKQTAPPAANLAPSCFPLLLTPKYV
ncbi:putative multidrug resistance-associated protein [Portunus trituberculatus]|uniref:Putative multidrug resistance-associated protein n=1 Tax=Portunus trituberculatus TaxID=210409 RepID=A0A5B7IXD5_PORTR|nr:putative multidrug resistance-associated protein [Portunus trituberculatus]